VRRQPCRRTQRARWQGAGSLASDVRPAGAADTPARAAGRTVTPKVALGAGVLRRNPPCQRTPKVALGAGVLRRNPPRQTVYQHQTDVLAAATGVDRSSVHLRAWKQRHPSTEEGRYLHRRARHDFSRRSLARKSRKGTGCRGGSDPGSHEPTNPQACQSGLTPPLTRSPLPRPTRTPPGDDAANLGSTSEATAANLGSAGPADLGSAGRRGHVG